MIRTYLRWYRRARTSVFPPFVFIATYPVTFQLSDFRARSRPHRELFVIFRSVCFRNLGIFYTLLYVLPCRTTCRREERATRRDKSRAASPPFLPRQGNRRFHPFSPFSPLVSPFHPRTAIESQTNRRHAEYIGTLVSHTLVCDAFNSQLYWQRYITLISAMFSDGSFGWRREWDGRTLYFFTGK